MPTQCYKHQYLILIRPDQTTYIVQGPSPAFGGGAVNVTAFAQEGVAALTPRYLEVIQMAVRRQWGGNEYDAFLDLVIRNNGHAGTGSGSAIDEFVTYTSVVLPP